MNGVEEILLNDARQSLLREVSGCAGKHDLQETFASWMLSETVAGVEMATAVQEALETTGAARTYREVAILGFAAHAGLLEPGDMNVFLDGLEWLIGREPLVNNIPMPFCTDCVALLAISVGATVTDDAKLMERVLQWLGRCVDAQSATAEDAGWQEMLLLAAQYVLGDKSVLSPILACFSSDVRVALRSKGLLPCSDDNSMEDDLQTIRLAKRSFTSLGVHHSVMRFAAVEWILSRDPQCPPQKQHSERVEMQSDQQIDARKVFVVHGRDSKARDALFTFLRAIGLHPLEWSEIVKATGKASPYIGEVLESGFSMVQAVIVLMTPDDEARLREEYQRPNDPPHEKELTPQARPNVIFEAGMALGLFSDRTVVVEIGQLRPMSDTVGRHVIRMDDSPEKRQDLAQRLETAGCAVNRDGTDWYSAGAFS